MPRTAFRALSQTLVLALGALGTARAETRTVVSHTNKATKGRLARDLLLEGGRPRSAAELADLLAGLGHTVETAPPGKPGQPARIDVLVPAG